MSPIRDSIVTLLKSSEIEYQLVTHEETPTSADSARVRGTTLEEGVKSIIVRGKRTKENYQFNVPSHLKLDMKLVSQTVGEKCEFEKPEVILEKFGLQIGGVPPFGNLLGLKNFLDNKITDTPRSAFNCGTRTESLIMTSEDLLSVCDPILGSFSKP